MPAGHWPPPHRHFDDKLCWSLSQSILSGQQVTAGSPIIYEGQACTYEQTSHCHAFSQVRQRFECQTLPHGRKSTISDSDAPGRGQARWFAVNGLKEKYPGNPDPEEIWKNGKPMKAILDCVTRIFRMYFTDDCVDTFLLHTTLLASVNIFSKHMSCMVLYPRIQQQYSDMQAMA